MLCRAHSSGKTGACTLGAVLLTWRSSFVIDPELSLSKRLKTCWTRTISCAIHHPVAVGWQPGRNRRLSSSRSTTVRIRAQRAYSTGGVSTHMLAHPPQPDQHRQHEIVLPNVLVRP
jgi:hypothetical protein